MIEDPGPDEPSRVERTGVLGGDPALLRERDTALGALMTVRAPTLAPLARARAVADAHALTHLVPADSVELAALREQVPLRPGHVVTVLVAVLEALDTVHRAHLAHGGVAADRVLVAPDGAVVLAGCGLAWAVPPGATGGPLAADDIAEVAVLARRLLGQGSAPPALVLALLRAADPEPGVRPGAADLAASVRAAVAPEPLLDLLWLAAPARPAPPRVPAASVAAAAIREEPGEALPLVVPTPGRTVPRPAPRRRRVPRALVALLAAPALLLAAAALLRGPTGAEAGSIPTVVAGPSSTPAPTTTGTPRGAGTTSIAAGPPGPTTDEVVEELARLDELRHQAVAAGSATLLADAVDPSGSAWADDAGLVARVRASGARLVGGAIVPVSVQVLARGTDVVRLRVRDVRTAYDVTVAGRTAHVEARPVRTWEVRMVRADGRWRISDVVESRPDQ